MKTKQASKRKRGRQLRSTGIVSLRRYLEENILAMERCEKRACRRGGFKRYWREGARKMKVHLKTVKAIEREAQANAKIRHDADSAAPQQKEHSNEL